MEETLSLPVNGSFDKQAVCIRSGQEPYNFAFPNHKFSRLLATSRPAEPMRVLYQFDGPATYIFQAAFDHFSRIDP